MKNNISSLEEEKYTVTEQGNLLKITARIGEDLDREYLIIEEEMFDFLVYKEEGSTECTADKRIFSINEAKVYWQ